jgi:pimeloyl-ACP methyl ester carboxylesterase
MGVPGEQGHGPGTGPVLDCTHPVGIRSGTGMTATPQRCAEMDIPDQWSAGTASTDDIDIHYYEAGRGQPVLAAHGMYDDGRRWVPLGSDLAREYRVIAYDARGHGGSDAPERGYDLDTRVGDLVGLVDALELVDPILVGHSMGGATAAWAAAEHPDMPSGLVLEDPARFRESPRLSVERATEITHERLRESKARSIEERIEKELADAGFEEAQLRRLAASVDQCSPHIARLAQHHPPVVDAFDEISCPTLVLRRDVEVSDRVADLAAADRLADGRLVHVAGAGHYVFRDAYDAANPELRAFLRRYFGPV